MKCTFVFVSLIGIFLPWVSSRHAQFYRKDYTYIEEYDAFYKVHWDLNGASWDTAFLTCDDEGATLFYPKVADEWTLIWNLTEGLPEIPNVTEIFVGLHNEYGLGEFITVDGHSTPYPLSGDDVRISGNQDCILMDIKTGIFRVDTCVRQPKSPLPFVCKKVDDESCPTVDAVLVCSRGPSCQTAFNYRGPPTANKNCYTYAKVSRKCYKVNRRPKMWQEAMQTCFMEGGILTVIKNRAEAIVIKEMLDTEDGYYFVGVRRIFSNGDYYAVNGQKYSEVYQQPNRLESQDCGTVFRSSDILYTSDKDCGARLPFICEMEVTVS